MKNVCDIRSIFFLSIKAWKKTKSVVEAKGRKTLPVQWVFNSKEEADGLIRLKSINVVKGYTQVPGVDFILSSRVRHLNKDPDRIEHILQIWWMYCGFMWRRSGIPSSQYGSQYVYQMSWRHFGFGNHK